MIITCDNCGKRYNLDPARIPGLSASIKCPECGHIFTVRKPGGVASGPGNEEKPSRRAESPTKSGAPSPVSRTLDISGLEQFLDPIEPSPRTSDKLDLSQLDHRRKDRPETVTEEKSENGQLIKQLDTPLILPPS